MILQALTEYYEALVRQGKLDRPGWSKVKVSYALELDAEGNLVRVHSLRQEVAQGRKQVVVPTDMKLPMQAKRSGLSIRPSFLCDNASYLLGIDDDNPKRAKERFTATKEFHLSLLQGINTNCGKSLCLFFEKWDPITANDRLKDCPYIDDIKAGANLVFLIDDTFAQTDPEIERAWQSTYDAETDSKELGRCLITGEKTTPEMTHPFIKGVPDAQPSGAALVSFNAPAFCSYGKEQNLNAPVGKYAAFAYTSALNYLIADRTHRKFFGDTVVAYWAENGEADYQDAFSMLMDCGGEGLTDTDLDDAMRRISQGTAVTWQAGILDPEVRFYILGIAPNAARLSVRFFLRDTFGKMVEHLYLHTKQIEIIPDRKTESLMLPLWRLLKATVNEKSKDKTASPKMVGETLRAILTGGRYPATLYQQVQLRIKADREITWERMAIVKAFLLRNSKDEIIKEAMTVQLNDQTTYQPYVLGRLFAVLEAVQERANPGINATIKDKYFSSASATPAVVFPTLLNLKDKHIRKLDGGIKIYYEKQVSELMLLLREDYPTHLSLQDQGVFQIGYYHQKQKRFEKKNQEEA